MNEGSIGSMRRLGITESYKLKRQVVVSASEAAASIDVPSTRDDVSALSLDLQIFIDCHSR